MPYPDELLFDYESKLISDMLGIDGIGQPMFDIANTSDTVTTYRFASCPRNGTLYVSFDRDEA
ncbi:MAG TPA: hypothetical protein VMY06_13415 [Sedimentisphaerales bacterium]|nr:hypothetical protein [Sedimentisphaerales bacterium]